MNPVYNIDPSGNSPLLLAGFLAAFSGLSLAWSIYSFIAAPSLLTAAWLAFDVATLPFGLGIKAIKGSKKAGVVLKGSITGLRDTRVESEIAAIAWSRTMGYSAIVQGEKLRDALGMTGKASDIIASDLGSQLVLIEAKTTLREARIIESVGKFENSFKALEEIHRAANWPFSVSNNVSELVITCNSVSVKNMGKYTIEGGKLYENGVPVTVRGLEVAVKEIPDFWPPPSIGYNIRQ